MEIKTTSVFLNNYTSKKKININRGWTRSWKTYNLMKLFLLWLLTGRVDDDKYFETWILSIVRKYWSTLTKTVQRDFDEIINSEMHDWKSVANLIEINKTERTYKYKWRVIEFIWADDQQKLRGWKRDILYCNEANELWYNNEFFQLLIRTKYKVFIDFNPDDEEVWINKELEQKRRIDEKDVRVIVSTYKDNPYLS
jgi:phage terminase large subunit